MREFGHVLKTWVKNRKIWTYLKNVGKKGKNLDTS
jgi:hypothetical protein